jgi:hypothetical protein
LITLTKINRTKNAIDKLDPPPTIYFKKNRYYAGKSWQLASVSILEPISPQNLLAKRRDVVRVPKNQLLLLSAFNFQLLNLLFNP